MKPRCVPRLPGRNQHQVFQHRHQLHFTGNLEGSHQTQVKGLVHGHPGNVRQMAWPASLKENPAAGGLQRAGNEVEQRCLARSVRAYDPGNLAGIDVQCTVINGPQSAKVLYHVADSKDWLGIRHAVSLCH